MAPENTPTLSRDERGLSVTTAYALNIVIAAFLMVVLVAAVQTNVDGVSATSQDVRFHIVGQEVTDQLDGADRLARFEGEGEGRMTLALPEDLDDSKYRVTVAADPGSGAGGIVYVASIDGSRNVSVAYNTTTPVAGATFTSDASPAIVYNDTRIEVEP